MNKFTIKSMNKYLFFKLPSAYFSGVRVSKLTDDLVEATVKYKWANQNPFKSIYWAVQGMASELTTGVLIMKHISDSGKNISMLVVHQSADFYKKAKGKVTFSCKDNGIIEKAISKTIETKEGQTFDLISQGVDQQGDIVSSFIYKWSIRIK